MSPQESPTPHTVEVDYRGEMLIYREPNRSTDVACIFQGQPRILSHTLSGWWYPGERRAERMSREERTTTLGRIAEYCRRHHGMPHLAIEGNE